jgi:fatty-acyl-CoA synthase
VALITAPSFKTSDYVAMLRSLAPELDASRPGALEAAKLPTLRHVIGLGEARHPGLHRYADLEAMAGAAERRRLGDLARELQFDDAINIQFTSGTTGAPKAATLTHHNILNNAYFVGQSMRLGPQDRLCIPVPMYHAARRCTACRPCSSPSSTIRSSGASTSPACAPASWRGRPARSS